MFRPSVWAIIRCDLQIKLYVVHGGGGGEISFIFDGIFLIHASMSCTEYVARPEVN